MLSVVAVLLQRSSVRLVYRYDRPTRGAPQVSFRPNAESTRTRKMEAVNATIKVRLWVTYRFAAYATSFLLFPDRSPWIWWCRRWWSEWRLRQCDRKHVSTPASVVGVRSNGGNDLSLIHI